MKTCEEAQPWLDAYLDGELDPMHSQEVERHLEECEACAGEVAARRELLSRIAAAPRYAAPEELRERIRAALRAEGGGEAAPGRTAGGGAGAKWRALVAAAAALAGGRSAWGGAAWGAAVLLLCGGLAAGGWILARHTAASGQREALADEVISEHVRSLMASHLIDVVSTDRHTVKPWFNGKIDFAPTVLDLSANGFPLAGGRLDYLDNRPAAALVYRRAQHVINLFVQPEGGSGESGGNGGTGVEAVSREGFHLRHWTQGGMSYWAVSDLNEKELQEFVELVQRGNG